MAPALTAASGDRVLFCDGDDCWDDPRTAAIQVECRDTHPDVAFC